MMITIMNVRVHSQPPTSDLNCTESLRKNKTKPNTNPAQRVPSCVQLPVATTQLTCPRKHGNKATDTATRLTSDIRRSQSRLHPRQQRHQSHGQKRF
jgi:hypothetical protein